jgi:RNA polymerase sigma-70 factor, ECF subfamily
VPTGEAQLDESVVRDFLANDYPRLVAAVTLISGSRWAAEDAVQEALARAWERSERGERIESLKAWVTVVAINLVRSGFRRLLAERRARERLGGRAHSDSAGPYNPDDSIDLARALASLPRRQREATILRYYLDMDIRDVATALRISEGTAKTTLHRARKALALALGDDESEEADDRVRR